MKENKIWNADCGDGTYANPILYTDYSDPDVCRVGDDYFMVASSFCNAPGLPVLHSKDLVNWKVISYAIDKVPGEQFEQPRHGCGVWAPAIRYHDGEFIIFFPMPDEGIYVVKTKDPWGKWEEPTCLFSGKGWIDPCPFWDDDGKAYMVSAFAKSRIGFKSILNLCEITPDCLQMIDEGKHIFDGNVENQETIEGPKMYKRNGYYYIFAPSGGVKQGWQTVLRSKNIWGPYEARNVMYQKDTPVNGPHQGAWVDTQTGEDWFIHFQDVYAAGRICHLQPMHWENEWPVIGVNKPGNDYGEPVMEYKKPNIGKSAEELADAAKYPVCCPDCTDEFDGDSLGLQWQWNANYESEWYSLENGSLRLNAVATTPLRPLGDVRNLLIQKWPAPEFVCETKMNLAGLQEGDTAGFISLGMLYSSIAVACEDGKYRVKHIRGEQNFDCDQAYTKEHVLDVMTLDDEDFKDDERSVYFRYTVKRTGFEERKEMGIGVKAPTEEITLEFSLDGVNYGNPISIASKAGRWVGVKSGVFCIHNNNIKSEAGYVTVEYVRYN